MQGRSTVVGRLVLLAAMMAVAAPVAAQQRSTPPMAARGSKSGQIFLVARMPETITLALDVNDDVNDPVAVAGSLAAFDRPSVPLVASSVTTSWVLAQGRSQVVTWVHVERPPAPVLIALATSSGVQSYGGTFLGAPPGFNFAPRASSSSRKLYVLNLMSYYRAAASTVSLSDSIEAANAPPVPEETYIGTMKIQVQAML